MHYLFIDGQGTFCVDSFLSTDLSHYKFNYLNFLLIYKLLTFIRRSRASKEAKVPVCHLALIDTVNWKLKIATFVHFLPAKLNVVEGTQDLFMKGAMAFSINLRQLLGQTRELVCYIICGWQVVTSPLDIVGISKVFKLCHQKLLDL